MKNEKRRTHKVLWGFIYVATFIVVFIVSVIFKMTYDPTHGAFKVEWNDSVGTIHADLSYADGEYNKYDLYLPADDARENYGLVVYLHAGGFTAGDKSGDDEMLK